MDEKTDHIEDLQNRLYARDPERVPQRKYGILRPIRQNVSSTWGETQMPESKAPKKTNVTGYKRFFVFSLIFFLIALGAALFSFFRGAVTLSSKNVDMTILGSSFVGGGEELPIQVEIMNKNSADLVDAELAIDYPKGATDESGVDMMHIVKPLGTIGSGKTKSEEFAVVLYGEQGTTRDIKATLTYKLAGSTALFQKEQSFSVMLNSSPFALVIDAPAAVGSGQPFTVTIRNIFNGDKPLSNTLARVEYPSGFVFQSSIPAPVAGNNIWDLGTMEQNTEHIIAIRGEMIGEERDEKSFRVYIGARENEREHKIAVTYNSSLHTTVITEPFISATIAANGQSSDIIAVPVGTPISGVVSWTSNSDTVITDPVFTLILTGESIDLDTIDADTAYFNPIDKTLTWTDQSGEALVSIEPGESGQFPFEFSTKPSQRDVEDIKLSLSIRGIFPERDYTQPSISSIDEKTIRFASRLQFAAQALHSIGMIQNTGPFPPKADQETSYTLVWTIRPTDNAISNARATATLPQGVTWAGVIVPNSESVTYNPDTRTVTWNIGSLPRATATPLSKSVAFQVKVKPTKAQIATELGLLGTTTISATDATANVPLTTTRPQLTTRLDTDPAYTPGAERVVP